ncbi:MAG: hypothetical protein HY784_18600, partial [Chloroflexi bacterium]|nr:hypothetical protein [Chloroflexota bacterium]
KLQPVEPGQIAVVTVAPGPGLARVFASLGVAGIVAGGQSMNPSTQEILTACENLPTDRVIILPNNKNIILASQAAAELTVKHVRIVPSRSIPQGIAAMIAHNPAGDLEAVANSMKSALEEVETGEITSSTRTVEIDGVPVREGQIIGLHNGKLVTANDDLGATLDSLLEAMGAADRELITLYYGEGVTAAEANALADHVRAGYPAQEVELHAGGQPHYHYIISAE